MSEPRLRAPAPLSLEEAQRLVGEQSSRSLRQSIVVLERRASARYDADPDDRRMEAAQLVLADRQRRLFRSGVLVAIVAFLWLLSMLGTDRPLMATAASLALIAGVVIWTRRG